ncbi:MAG TPA: hypothetical protein PKZ76_03110 [Xanthomonadaceae bacterium]|nr:hypothetical protein [Xanthomonadaceae bacterium]
MIPAIVHAGMGVVANSEPLRAGEGGRIGILEEAWQTLRGVARCELEAFYPIVYARQRRRLAAELFEIRLPACMQAGGSSLQSWVQRFRAASAVSSGDKAFNLSAEIAAISSGEGYGFFGAAMDESPLAHACYLSAPWAPAPVRDRRSHAWSTQALALTAILRCACHRAATSRTALAWCVLDGIDAGRPVGRAIGDYFSASRRAVHRLHRRSRLLGLPPYPQAGCDAERLCRELLFGGGFMQARLEWFAAIRARTILDDLANGRRRDWASVWRASLLRSGYPG